MKSKTIPAPIVHHCAAVQKLFPRRRVAILVYTARGDDGFIVHRGKPHELSFRAVTRFLKRAEKESAKALIPK